MKTNIMVGTIVSLLLSFAPHVAGAGILDGLGKWEGSGTAFDIFGKDLGAFTVSLTRKNMGASKVRADGKVTLSSGQEIAVWEE